MHMNTLPARAALSWFKAGWHSFTRQPFAFLIFGAMVVTSLIFLGAVPYAGSSLALFLMPGVALFWMVMGREAEQDNAKLTELFRSAFAAVQSQWQALLVLGGAYLACYALALSLSALIDGGELAQLMLGDNAANSTDNSLLIPSESADAALLFFILYLPISLLFWHAPALVYWGGMSPLKSLFFSWVACWRNWTAYLVLGLIWLVLPITTCLLILVLAAMLGNFNVPILLIPTMLLLFTVFSASLYANFRDNFST